MQTGNNGIKTNEREVIAGIKVIETEYRITKPIFEEIKVDRPIFVDKRIEIPVGWDRVINELALEISSKILEKVESTLAAKLDKAIDTRIRQIEVPTIIYKTEERIINVDKPVYKDVSIERPIYTDKEIINPILVDKNIVNPVFEDVPVERPVFKDRIVIQPKFEEVIIHKPKFVDKEITVIHPKYIDMKGNPEENPQ